MTNPPMEAIVARATPPGRAGIGIVRLSGDGMDSIAHAILGALPAPRRATFTAFRDADGSALDSGIALYFPAPHSFTGEDVLEFQGHGGPVILDMLIARLCELGARPARAGEFSERAFANGKLDLAQAEAIADLIASSSDQAARTAMRSVQGDFSAVISRLINALTDLRIHLEAAFDFPDEDLDILVQAQVEERLAALLKHLHDVFGQARQGNILREGYTLVIAGRPNAGKSSLLNRLAGQDAAIVTPIPGTTRDVVRAEIELDGLPVRIIDTAGLREGTEPIEQEGVRRAWQEIRQADLIGLVIDSTLVDSTLALDQQERAIQQALPVATPLLRIWNKIDLAGMEAGARDDGVHLSAQTGAGLADLQRVLKDRAGYDPAEGGFMTRRRHLAALESARESIQRALEQMQSDQASELIAEELKAAHRALGEITGEYTTEDLLGDIFSSFCIGK